MKKLIFKFNHIRTKKKFTHKIPGGTYFTVASDRQFFKFADLGYNLFTMQCLQGYVQLDNGKWKKSSVLPFESRQEMIKAGVVTLPLSAKDS